MVKKQYIHCINLHIGHTLNMSVVSDTHPRIDEGYSADHQICLVLIRYTRYRLRKRISGGQLPSQCDMACRDLSPTYH